MKITEGKHPKTALFVLVATLALAALPAVAQDPVKLAPDHIKVVLENDRVRVLDDRSKPGDKEGLHSHPACIIHVLTGGKIRSTSPDGKVTVAELKAGDTLWREPLTHSVENIGTTELHLLLVELKK
ncbi:MAG TPA: cytoplasmic protein [Thermoanaerobaculia bacterium]